MHVRFTFRPPAVCEYISTRRPTLSVHSLVWSISSPHRPLFFFHINAGVVFRRNGTIKSKCWCHPRRSNPSPSVCEVDALKISYWYDYSWRWPMETPYHLIPRKGTISIHRNKPKPHTIREIDISSWTGQWNMNFQINIILYGEIIVKMFFFSMEIGFND